MHHIWRLDSWATTLPCNATNLPVLPLTLRSMSPIAIIDPQPLLMQLKARALKDKARQEVKAQAVKAKVQAAITEEQQRKALHVKRAPSAYILFMKDQIKAVSHVAPADRFKVRRQSLLCFCTQCTASQRLDYEAQQTR